jgi:hypothetical protein
VLAACSPSLPEPSISGVEPSWAYNGESQQVTVLGEHFYPQVELDVREDGGRLDRQFDIDLERDGERYALEGVELQSYEQLVAWVPEGLPVGRYNLVVTTPTEQQARLPRGFDITDTRADHLSVDIDGVTFLVKESFDVSLSLRDPQDEILLQALEVQLDITGEQGPDLESLELDTSSFESVSSEPIQDGIRLGFTLRAGSAERNIIGLSSHEPGLLEFELSVPDEESVISAAQALVEITPASLSTVDIQLPHSDFDTTAGDAFEIGLRLVDEFDNLIEHASATLVLQEECGSASQAVEFRGETRVSFAPTGATGDDCNENRILASGTVSGSSEPFQVHPDDPVAYAVSVFPSSLVAGDEMALVVVTAMDEWGNRVFDYGEDWEQQNGTALELTLVDELGGLNPASGHGTQSCPGFDDGYQICQAWLTTAGEEDRITATGEDGLQGKSGRFEVTPASLADFDLDHDPPPFEAGVAFDLFVRPTDRFGNTVVIDPGVDPIEIEGVPHAISCGAPSATAVSGEWSFPCIATVAEEDQKVEVSIPSVAPSISRTLSEGFEVTNGALGLAVFQAPSAGSEVAGQAFGVELDVYDAYGNPYLVQGVNSVSLQDCSGSMLPASLPFDAAGHGEVNVTITQASLDCTILAYDGVTLLGSSLPFDIEPAAFSDLELSLSAPWVFVGESIDLRVEAVDVYGNTITDFGESVSLETRLGSAEAFELDAFDEGVATVQPSFLTAQLADSFVAESDSGVVASSASLDVLDSDCGVEAELLVDGHAQPVLCLGSGTVTATLDASGSTGSVTGYHFDDGAGTTSRGVASSVGATWTEQAAYRARAVAFDATACGSVSEVTVWVAEPDGEPAGPVTIVPVDTTRVVGSSHDGSTLVDLQAYDCAGDVAAFGTLWVRTTLGEISGATSSGQGLSLTLDSSGIGQFGWSVATETHGGVSTVLAGRPGAVAIGSAEITVLGDDEPPVVLELDPVGSSTEITDTFEIRLDGELLEASVRESQVQLSDGVGPLDLAAVELDDSGEVIVITTATSVDLAADVYTLTLDDGIRDSAGNRLAGQWDGMPAPFTVQLGAVADTAPNMTTCTPDTLVLRPDGDDVPATDEADDVSVDLVADGPASWWLLELWDQDGAERTRHWLAAGGASTDTVSWDARDQDGSVLPNGDYTLYISASDVHLDLGVPCAIELSIDNTVVEAP